MVWNSDMFSRTLICRHTQNDKPAVPSLNIYDEQLNWSKMLLPDH